MSRYIIRIPVPAKVRSSNYDYDESFRPSLDVDGPAEVDTGLVCLLGNPIMRLPPPIGFGREEEW